MGGQAKHSLIEIQYENWKIFIRGLLWDQLYNCVEAINLILIFFLKNGKISSNITPIPQNESFQVIW